MKQVKMKRGPLHLTVEGDECLMCYECGRYVKNDVAFVRARVVKDRATGIKYSVGVVYHKDCELKSLELEEEAKFEEEVTDANTTE